MTLAFDLFQHCSRFSFPVVRCSTILTFVFVFPRAPSPPPRAISFDLSPSPPFHSFSHFMNHLHDWQDYDVPQRCSGNRSWLKVIFISPLPCSVSARIPGPLTPPELHKSRRLLMISRVGSHLRALWAIKLLIFRFHLGFIYFHDKSEGI